MQTRLSISYLYHPRKEFIGETRKGTNMDAREFQINIRLNGKEYQRLSRAAALRAMGRATYVRMLLCEKWNEEAEKEETKEAKEAGNG